MRPGGEYAEYGEDNQDAVGGVDSQIGAPEHHNAQEHRKSCNAVAGAEGSAEKGDEGRAESDIDQYLKEIDSRVLPSVFWGLKAGDIRFRARLI